MFSTHSSFHLAGSRRFRSHIWGKTRSAEALAAGVPGRKLSYMLLLGNEIGKCVALGF